jgi:hypothetical protein
MGLLGTRLVAAAFLLGISAARAGQDGGAAPASSVPEASGFDAEEVKAAVARHVDAQQREGGGVYRLKDDLTGEQLDLEFVDIGVVGSEALWKIHDAARHVNGSGYFACTHFHPVGAPGEKLYDIDFRVARRDGMLEVIEASIHKEPRLEGGKWVRVERYRRTR